MTISMKTIREISFGVYDGPHATPELHDEGAAVFLGIPNLLPDGRINLTAARWVAERDISKWTRRVTPQANDIVFTYEATLNRYAIIPKGDFRFCLGRRTALIRPDPSQIDHRYLFYYFFSPRWRAQVEANTLTGATVDRIPLTTFPDFDVFVPDLREQGQIAEILSDYDELIATNQRRIKLLEESARLLYREWFIHLRFPGHESVPVKVGLPLGWRRQTLGSLCDSVDGAVVQTGPFGSQLHQHDYKDSGTPVVMPQDIVGDRIRMNRIAHVDEQTAIRLSRHRLRPLDIVFPRRGDITKRALVETHQDGFLCGTGCLKISLPPEPLHPLLLYFQLADPDMVKWIEGQAVGATMLNLSGAILRSIECLVPSNDVQERFVDSAHAIRQQIDLLEMQSAHLANARDLLLPKLMSGQLDVSHITLPEEVVA
ncbi:MAG: restriction endonuclease subunit S [Azonexus sp.]|jgi:type I restriction enzyme S subunit|nr:restriction endonuclease subunit S [Azonexus sp.]